jgi:hypothetical protein
MDFAELFDGIVHEPSQSAGAGFDLTVDRVLEVTGAGRIDFGGGELEPAAIEPVPTEKRDPEDDYGWWHLGAGRYLLEYNESITSAAPRLTVQPRTELLERGGAHPTITVGTLPRMSLSIGGAGLSLKENARVSTVVRADSA